MTHEAAHAALTFCVSQRHADEAHEQLQKRGGLKRHLEQNPIEAWRLRQE